ncbi:MAG TPA: Uma2 family endonuclease [Thermomicrobiales bacterium]|nr:Uma2 family endonuclease [Thermomicrobiales bacterium]
MATTTRRFTADDLFDLGEDAPYELIRGVLREVTPTTGKHGWVTMRFAWQLGQVVFPEQRGVLYGAETGFVIEVNPDTVLAPDLAFVRRERLSTDDDQGQGFVSIIPDLVIEVISPSNRRAEIEEKTELYLNAGVALLWWLDPRRHTVTVNQSGEERRVLMEQDILDGGDVLPGFQISVAEIFRLPF